MARERSRRWGAGLLTVGLAAALGAAPPTPSYRAVERRVEEARARFSADPAEGEKGANWITFFDALDAELQEQAGAETPSDRREHLERLGRMRDALAGSGWGPASRVSEALSSWLEPRLEVARALEALEAAVSALPGPSAAEAGDGGEGEGEAAEVDPQAALKRTWSSYVEDLNAVILAYESAGSMTDRINASRRLRGALASLRQTQASHPWTPGLRMLAALERTLDGPNVQVAADTSIVQPFLDQQVVRPEVIFFKGQTSTVQPGPKTGFGLLASDGGIAFVNSQWSYSTTPIAGFHEQVAQDPQGRQAANLYYFSATSFNTNHVTATAVLTPSGVTITPQNAPSITAAIDAVPQAGHGPHVVRTLGSLVGLTREAILDRVREQALPRIQQETAQGTNELAAIKSGQQAAQTNAELARFLVGNRTLRFQDFAVSGLAFSSRPWAAFVDGVVGYASEEDPRVGSDFPKPDDFGAPQYGLTLDVHLNSALTNLAAGAFRSPEIAGVENLLVKIVPPEGEAPLGEGLEVSQNASYQDLLDAIADVRSRSNDANATALRVRRPGQPPAFAVDSAGNLVALVRDVTIEVPAPENFGGGGLLGFGQNPRVLRFEIEQAEVTLSASFTAEDGGRSVKVLGRVETVTYGGPGTTVVTVGDQEDQTAQLNLLNRSAALGALAGQLQGQEVNTSLPTDALQGFLVQSISPIDPTGWLRVVLQRDPSQPVAVPAGLASAPAPAAEDATPALVEAPEPAPVPADAPAQQALAAAEAVAR